VLLQIRNDPSPNPIPQRRQVLVGSVFAKLEPVRANVSINVRAPNVEQGTNHAQIRLFKVERGCFTHGGQSRASGAAEKIDQKCFDQVVGVMRNENLERSKSLRSSREKR